MGDDQDLRSRLEGLFSDLESPMEGEKGSSLFLEGGVEDIVGRAQPEEQLAIFRVLADNAADSIFMCDLEGRVTYSNRACYKLFDYDYKQQEMTGRPLTDFWPEEDVATFAEEVLPQAMGGSWSGKVRQKRRDGTLFDARLTVFAVLDEAGQPVGVTALAHAITEPTWAARALEKQQVLLQQIDEIEVTDAVQEGFIPEKVITDVAEEVRRPQPIEHPRVDEDGIARGGLRRVSNLVSSIRTKIVLPYAVLTLAVAAIGTFVITQLVAGSLEERFVNQLVEAGRVTSDGVVRKERDHLEALRAMAFTQGVDAAVASGDMHTLEELLVPLAVNHLVDSVEVTDGLGKELLGFRHHKDSEDVRDYTLTTGTDLSTWPIVGSILAGKVDRYGDKFVMLVKEPSGYMFYTGGPIKYEDRIVGTILLGTYLDHLLADIKREALADITFYDDKGKVHATTLPGGEEQVKDLLEITPTFSQSILARPDETLRHSVAVFGRSYWMVYGLLQIRGELLGIYSVALPSNFIVEKAATSRLQFSVIFTTAMVLVFIMGYLISRRIIGPIIRLVQTSRAVAAGDLSQQTGIRSRDEIGILASSFDQMTRSLRERTQQLEEEASKIRAILESIADGVIVEGRDSQVILMNPAAERMLGSMSEAFLTKPVRELPAIRVGDESSSDSSEDRRFEAGGRVISAREAPVVTRDGAELGKVVVFRDVTREVEIDRLKDEFIENVSHELRTPLTAIKGYTDLLMLTVQDKLSEQQRRSLGYISERSSQLVTMIGELLDMTDIAAGTLGLDLTRTSLDELVLEVMDSWQEQIEEKQLTAIAQLPNDLPKVSVDRDRIRRVLSNLISNACNYTMPGGRITVAAYVEGNKARVDVEDTGFGISEQDQTRLFTRFFRARNVPHDDVRGAGLGLYMAKALIEAHGERIWLERSKLGEGSVFSLTLPLAEDQEVRETNSFRLGVGKAESVKHHIVVQKS